MNEELELLKTITQQLNEADIPYMVSGSMASNYYSVPRMTRDIDIVIELKISDINKFINLFQEDYYIDKEMVTQEVAQKGMFNIIHNQYIIKIDFIIKKDFPFQQISFSRKKNVIIDNRPIWFISPEDLIIFKLLWVKDSVSELQLKDVQNLLKTVNNIDLKYIEKWIPQLELESLYKNVKL